MATNDLRQRYPAASVTPKAENGAATNGTAEKIKSGELHPGGAIKHGTYKQALRMALFAAYFNGCCVCILVSQLLGAPLYFYDRDLYYAWMAMTKQHFGLVITTMTQWWSPTTVRISGDKSVRGQLRQTADGRIECDFPERIVLIANHQIYTDWLYLWWIAYTAKMHGHIYIILKESIKWIPVIGQGMMFYGFIFLTRKWSTDKPRFKHRLQKLNSKHGGMLSGSQELDPMWLLIFPEGTNLSNNGRNSSAKWAEKNGIPDLQHALLPRSTGLLFCLREMRNTVDWVYDCTVTYEGVPRGQFGQDIFTLRSTYFQGRPPKSVNMHWRRFATSSIPMDDTKEFEKWVLQRWIEKDQLLEHFVQTGRFPADDEAGPSPDGTKEVKGAGHIETEVRTANPLEFLQIFLPGAALLLVINVLGKIWRMFVRGIFGS
ncbi:acyltransferase-domain-containing protein [Mytilinidion resinicola]|uniref:Acyltransferase-domain-containing protein n=1 Tax=Mytilinidion resinicola TaxID=574789 RepID=A0A6A6YQ97_9PEZI|nr:acyltransferase-domain-containing protein [Mytilinidion resinicola]KAF2811076.1 acyltransferase-domain-containing protein [Mytilinidion resinicola]